MLSLEGKIHQTSAVIPVALLMSMYGLGSGWLGPTLNHICNSTAEFSLTHEQCSWVGSLHYIGKIIGTMLAAMLVDILGRNLVFLSCSVQFIGIWSLIWLTKNVPALYFGRVAYGIASGMTESIMPIYIAENTSPSIRGMFCSMAFGFMFGGSVVSYALTTFFSYDTVALTNTLIAIAILFSLVLLKETPQALLARGKEKEAEQRFIWLRGAETPDIKYEFYEIKQNMDENKNESTMPLVEAVKVPENFRTLRIVLLTNVLILLTGYTGINSFITMSLAPSPVLTADQLTILYGVIQFVSVYLLSIFIDRHGRRTALFVGSVVSFLSHVSSAALHQLHQTHDIPFYPWLLFASNTTYAVTFAAILAPMFTVIRGEVLPPRMKALGSSVALVSNSLVSFMVAKSFLIVSNDFGISANYILYSFASIALLIYTYLDVPETRGKTLVMIQQELKK